MKNLIFLLFAILVFESASAQFIQFGIKGGLNYNSNGNLRDLSGFEDDFKIKSNEENGYHLGVLMEIDLPLWIYLRPELVYTHTESSYKESGYRSTLEMNKFDVPILAGVKVLRIGRIFAGPVFSYAFDTDLKSNDIFDEVKKIDSEDFAVNGQIGLGVELGNLGADVRWELGLSDTQAEFEGELNNNIDLGVVRVDTSPSQVIFSLYYKF